MLTAIQPGQKARRSLHSHQESAMLTVTHDFVIGQLKALASQDPQVLESRRQQLIQQQQPLKLGSLAFLIIGAIMTISVIGAIVGLPMLAIAGWVQWKARTNLKVIDGAYREFTSGGESLAVPG